MVDRNLQNASECLLFKTAEEEKEYKEREDLNRVREKDGVTHLQGASKRRGAHVCSRTFGPCLGDLRRAKSWHSRRVPIVQTENVIVRCERGGLQDYRLPGVNMSSESTES